MNNIAGYGYVAFLPYFITSIHNVMEILFNTCFVNLWIDLEIRIFQDFLMSLPCMIVLAFPIICKINK